MHNDDTQNIWTVLEEILHEQGFSEKEINDVKIDLENLAKEETITNLLEKLSKAQQQELKELVANQLEKDKTTATQNYLRKIYRQEELSKQLFSSAQNVLKDYLDNLFNKVDEKSRQQILIKLTPQIHSS